MLHWTASLSWIVVILGAGQRGCGAACGGSRIVQANGIVLGAFGDHAVAWRCRRLDVEGSRCRQGMLLTASSSVVPPLIRLNAAVPAKGALNWAIVVWLLIELA